MTKPDFESQRACRLTFVVRRGSGREREDERAGNSINGREEAFVGGCQGVNMIPSWLAKGFICQSDLGYMYGDRFAVT